MWLLASSRLVWSCSELCFQLLILLLKLFDTLSERLVDFFEGVIASVASNVASPDFGSAVRAGELDGLALVQPVQPERFFEVEHPICVGAPWNFAFDFVSARLPVLLALLVRELLGALVAVEQRRVQRLKHESVDILAKVDRAAAVGARVLSLPPLRDAGVAAKLIAFLALFRVLNDHEADRAGEILVELGRSLL